MGELTIDLRLGNCLEILPTLEAESVDAVVTDPPYGIGFKYETHDDDENHYAELMGRSVLAAERIVKSDGALFWWQGMKRASDWYLWFPSGYRIIASCKDFVQMRPTRIQYAFDPIIFWYKGGKQPKRKSFGSRTENAKHKLWDWHIAKTSKHINDAKTKGIHPCQRPIDAVVNVVLAASEPGDTILDPFMGSGTTGVACVKTGRNFVGIEIDEGYYEIAQKRIEETQLQMKLPLEVE